MPNIITNVAITHAAVPDVAMTAPIHQALEARDLLPGEHYVDSGYPSGRPGRRIPPRPRGHADHPAAGRSSPPRPGPATGFDRTAFTIDFDTRTARCPQGQTSSSWNPLSPARHRRDRDQVRHHDLRALPGPRPVHHRQAAADASSPCGPASCHARPAERPRRAEHRRLASEVRHPRRRRGHHPPGRRQSPASAAPATAACRKSTSNTPSPPSPST